MLLAALNEEHGIGSTVKDLKRFLGDPVFLVIDGRSVDKTVKIAKNFGVTILKQLGNGKCNAITQGIECKNFSGKYAIIIDADFTYPAKFIPYMVKILDKRPQVGMVCGNRFNDKYVRSGMKNMFFSEIEFYLLLIIYLMEFILTIRYLDYELFVGIYLGIGVLNP